MSLRLITYIISWIGAAAAGLLIGAKAGAMILAWFASFDMSESMVRFMSWIIYWITLPTPFFLALVLIEKTVGDWYRIHRPTNPSKYLHCLACDYDLRRSTLKHCPECGAKISWTQAQRIRNTTQQNA